MKQHIDYGEGRCPNGGKVQYATPAKAHRAARIASPNDGSGRARRAYLCPACGFYHLTRQDQRAA
jgi:hypothetical protein